MCRASTVERANIKFSGLLVCLIAGTLKSTVKLEAAILLYMPFPVTYLISRCGNENKLTSLVKILSAVKLLYPKANVQHFLSRKEREDFKREIKVTS